MTTAQRSPAVYAIFIKREYEKGKTAEETVRSRAPPTYTADYADNAPSAFHSDGQAALPGGPSMRLKLSNIAYLPLREVAVKTNTSKQIAAKGRGLAGSQ
ncbi:hypothetical protein [Rhizobium mayense]|uniref:Uncharacterized protein n=1 Tax=Rhizobium mayense TaxID=1312184 RepID=A0ABT7K5S0_9HYPH|nr:hypothetical protein [Rhizobium mayense]MDL2403960.1 hypothetical protein [Rhizobium mayense]